MERVDLTAQASSELLDRVRTFLVNIRAFKGLVDETKSLDELAEQIDCLKTVLGSLRKTVESSEDFNLLCLSRPLDECHETCKSFCQAATGLGEQTNATNIHERSLYVRHRIRRNQGHIDHLRWILNGYQSTFEVVLSAPKP